MTPRRVPYIMGRSILVVPTSKTVSNLEDLEFFYNVIKDLPNCVMMDIGANKGYYALLTTIKNDMRFLSFEPLPHIFKNFLTRNIYLNGVQNRGRAFNHGFSKESCLSELYYDNSENASLMRDTEKESEIAKAIAKNPKRASFLRYSKVQCYFSRLDDVMDRVERPEIVSAIKLDAEGAESWIIDGGPNFLSKTNAPLFVEIEQRHCDRFRTTVDSVIDKLRAVGYVRFEQVRNNYLCTKK